MQQKVLNLRQIRFQHLNMIEQEIFSKLDEFVYPFLKTKKPMELKIIVGKGMNSRNFIKGKNPLRHYTETYLNKLGLSYRDGGYFDGQEGVIVVSL
jgi:hypothetical protein